MTGFGVGSIRTSQDYLVLVCLVVCIWLCRFDPASSASTSQWKSRTIYQLLTDRFANTNGQTSPCPDLSQYCGGSFQGIISQLDYIAGMGFDAIWISPIVENTPSGYHGYWMKDLYRINPHFGTAKDLNALVQAAHQRGIYVMVDVVANHVGENAPLSSIYPFNNPKYYHDCSGCPEYCSIQDFTCFTNELELCRLDGLPDLNQSVPFVQNTFYTWINRLVQNYSIDGLRIDTVPEVGPQFWKGFINAAGTYAVGEVFSDIGCCVAYQKAGVVGVLSYPMFWTLRSVFQQQQSMNQIQSQFFAYQAQFPDVDALGTFIDNHDNARFLSDTSDIKLYENAIVYTLLSTGIPIIYYGTEQGFSGGNDPANRESLWQTDYNVQSQLYQFIKLVVGYRKNAQVWTYPQVQRYSDDSFYAFTRGDTFVALTNAGSNSGGTQRTITYHPYPDGTKLCNLFWPNTDCLVVTNGQFNVYLLNGECKIYYPVS